jgi:cell division protein FtsI (penicillin-binding protein 3)
MPGRTVSRIRLLVLLTVFVVSSLALTARAAYWQVIDRDRLVLAAADQTTVRLETPSQRGDVYDRSGTVILATTVQRERLVAAPYLLSPDERRTTVAELARLFELDDAATLALREKLASDDRYLVLRHGLDRTTADRIRAGVANGRMFALSLEPEPERVYPQVGGGRTPRWRPTSWAS